MGCDRFDKTVSFICEKAKNKMKPSGWICGFERRRFGSVVKVSWLCLAMTKEALHRGDGAKKQHFASRIDRTSKIM